MSAVVEHQPKIRPVNVSEYLKMAEVGILEEDEAVELIDGRIVEMSPTGFFHSSVVGQLSYLFNKTLNNEALVWVQSSVFLDNSTMPEPDITLVKFREDFYRQDYVKADDILLVIEVSDTTLDYDRNTKTALYANFKIPEMWLVDVKNKTLTRYLDPVAGQYQKIDIIESQTLSLTTLKQVSIDLSNLF